MNRYAVKVLRITRGHIQENRFPPAREIKSFTRLKLARGECRAQRNSEFDYLTKHFEVEPINYHEYDDYYIFIVEDEEGIAYESHIFLESIDA